MFLPGVCRCHTHSAADQRHHAVPCRRAWRLRLCSSSSSSAPIRSENVC
jgi:hypothetical protein